MKKLIRFSTPLLTLLLVANVGYSQLTVSGDLAILIDNIVDEMPGSTGDDYELPSASQLSNWQNTLEQLFAGNLALAAEQADALGYDLTLFLDIPTQRTYQVLTSQDENYWGTYIFYPQYCRNLVLQSPHPRRDFNTGRQGLHVFRESESLAFMMAGTHRCNSDTNSSCSGTTGVCSGGSSQAYPITDVAHHVENIFQLTTDFLLQKSTESYFISLHGFTKGPTDPYLIMSNGTRQAPDPDYIEILAQALQEEDPVLDTEAAHLNLSWTRLIGFTNVQGRLINESSEPCSQNASLTNGRFLHVEQEKTRLRDNLAGWNKMANAVNATFACMPVSTEEVVTATNLEIYPNPTNARLSVRAAKVLDVEAIHLYNSLGQKVTISKELATTDPLSLYLDLSGLPIGLYYLHYGSASYAIILQH